VALPSILHDGREKRKHCYQFDTENISGTSGWSPQVARVGRAGDMEQG